MSRIRVGPTLKNDRTGALAPSRARLRLVQTSDLHATVLAHDYLADRPLPVARGLAASAARIAEMRGETPNLLLFDTGDALQGSALADHVAFERAPGLHPVIAAMNAVGYDAAAPGNHDFDYGLHFLQRAMAQAHFPVVCANVERVDDGAPVFLPVALLDRKLRAANGRVLPIRIGVIGFIPPQTKDWDLRVFGEGLRSRDIVSTARRHLPSLRAAGAELVVALAHSGIEDGRPTRGQENASLHLARLPGIDVILAGHSHRVLPGPDHAGIDGCDADAGTLHGVPATMPGFNGSHLGVIDLELERSNNRWTVVTGTARAEPLAAGQVPHPAVVRAVEADHAATLKSLGRPLGQSETALQTYFALVAPSAALSLMADAMRWGLTNELAGTGLADIPVLAAVTPFLAGGFGGPDAYVDIPPGPLDFRALAQLYVYPNALQGLLLTGAEIRDWLDRSAGLFARIRPGLADQPLFAPGAASYNFDVIDGLRYRIDLTCPARYDAEGGATGDVGSSRITGLSHRGRPVMDGDRFILATNSYRAAGGGRFPGTAGKRLLLDGRRTTRDTVAGYVSAQGTVAPMAGTGWGFVQTPGTSVRFLTGPGAAGHDSDPAGTGLERLGPASDGFLAYRLHL